MDSIGNKGVGAGETGCWVQGAGCGGRRLVAAGITVDILAMLSQKLYKTKSFNIDHRYNLEAGDLTMVLQVDAAQAIVILHCLYNEARRASNVAREVQARHSISHDEFVKIIEFLTSNDMITNIEKNRSNGDAVYKLTRKGESLLEHRIPSMYQRPAAKKGKGEYAC
jgi:predicted transcriptional regulator